MTNEKAIKWMEEAVQETTECFEQCSPTLQEELIKQKEVFELALTALRSMQEAGEPFHIDRSKWKPCEFATERRCFTSTLIAQSFCEYLWRSCDISYRVQRLPTIC